ncbi:TolC family protein [Terriglobus roseus]|nr:TolC family protein [Terriglobus roseus]
MSLEQAITMVQANEPQYAAAVAERGALALERTNAKTALLPTVTYHNQAVYTQPNGVAASRIGQVTGDASPLFIANNAIREYASQGVVDERIGLGQIAAIRSATASALRAEAEAEVARRGLVVAVTNLFYGSQGAGQKATVAAEALNEANHFLDITQKREQAREVAHADVLKAQLQQQQRERDLADAKLAATKARLELGVLLYPDPSTPYTLDIPAIPPPLPDRPGIDSLAKQNNPEIRSAIAGLQVAQADTFASKAALTPDLALNYTYGIDATNFGVNGPDGIRNLGYAMSATLDIPVWDWLATERRIRASKLRAGAARVVLTAAQRRLLANLEEFYAEADLAAQQLRSLDASVITARESLRLTNLRYVDGESTALEVVDAQAAVINAETAQVDGQLRYQLARAQLQTLTGRLP